MSAFITELATLAETASGTTHTLTLGAGVSVGDLLVLGVGMTSASTTFGTPTDTGGNTWAAGSTLNVSTPSLGHKCAIFWCVATVAMVATNTVQFTTSASTRGEGILVSFSGSAGTTATVNDVTASTSSGATGTAVSIGPTATTAGADICVAICDYSAAGVVVATGGWTLSTTDHVASNNGGTLTLVYLIATQAEAETATLTLPATSGWMGIIQTFKAATATVPGGSGQPQFIYLRSNT